MFPGGTIVLRKKPIRLLARFTLAALLFPAATAWVQAANLKISNPTDECCLFTVGYWKHKGIPGGKPTTYYILPKTDIELKTQKGLGGFQYIHWINYSITDSNRELQGAINLAEFETLDRYAARDNKETNNANFIISIKMAGGKPKPFLVEK